MKKILIAEDDAFLSKAYRLKLTKAGYEVKLAQDGQEVLALLENFIPDVILLDLIMPVMDGFSVLKALQANVQWKTIPVIISSNLSQQEDITKTKELGAQDYFIKTDLDLTQLLDKINSVVK